MIGRVFDDRYEIIRRLGSGGMADVYLAHDRHLDRRVALKILHPRLAEDDQFIERFRREASAAAGLNHPNIVQIYDRGEAEGTYYIAMEYLEGRALKDIIHAHAPLRAEHIISVTKQILEALRFAHRRDIVHRDIKPQNIMVDEEGRVKVTDFGIARAGSEARMTDTGSIVGTAHYLSPEQASGGRVGASSDLYSLGVVMYEMATGRLPFTGENPVAIAMRHVNEAPVPPGDVNPSLPENLERVILRALAKHPEQRYGSAEAFEDDLVRVEGGHMVAAPAPFAEEEAATRVMGASPPAAMAPPAGRTMVRPGPPVRSGAGAVIAEEERRSRVWPWILVLLFLLLLAGAVYALVSLQGDDAQLVDVPSVVGQTEQAARQDLDAVGLTMAVQEERLPSADVPEGSVVDQEPDAGTKLEEGGEVQVWLSSGPEQSEVPDVRGQTLEQARTVLGQAGFAVDDDPQDEPSEEFDEGEITRQDPAGGESAAPGTVIELWVSSGPAVVTVEVPNLVGRSEETAVALLEEANLVPDRRSRESDQPEGTVIEQTPAAGREVAEGSAVTIVVSSGPGQVEVPDVVGDARQQAEVTLGQAGLRVSIGQQIPDESPAGTVIDQDPEGGQRVERGSTVTLIVSSGPETTTTGTPTTLGPPGASAQGRAGSRQASDKNSDGD